jgi:hypothetical protein
MFFILGISQKEKKLDYDELVVCKCCNKYGHIEVFLTYSYFFLFFIPIFKWNKKYYVRMSCCNAIAEIEDELGRKIERNEISHIDLDKIDLHCNGTREKICSNCGYLAEEDFIYCPRCGAKL